MNTEILSQVRTALTESPFLRAVASVRNDRGQALALGPGPLRALREDEIAGLERLGNSADDWSRIRVAEGFDWQRVRQTSFHGEVLLGRFTHSVPVVDGLQLPAGLYQATVADCVIGHEALVRDVQLLANCVVGEAVVLLGCGSVTCDGRTTFGHELVLPIAIETGGREVPAYAEIDIDVAAVIARCRAQHDLLRSYAEVVREYRARAQCPRLILERGAVVRHTPRIQNTYVGPAALIDGATLLTDSTLLSSAEEPCEVRSGACVTRSLLQWGSSVATLALVDRSVLTEHAHVERHGKVTQSLLGPNTGVAEGEVTASLVGPLVSFHHQALLIAALWPEGRGNVAYGANVGCNHTSRAPDQEFWPGEGAFLGLGVNIKYPADFSQAPYTVVACSVTTLPQRVTFPFALINQPSATWPGVPSAYNEIIPAWGLSENLYMLRRAEEKHRARNQARRWRSNLAILRSDIVDLMRAAYRRLEAIREVKEVYTDRDLEGLGKNYLLEKQRGPAAAAYRFYISAYALLGLKERVQEACRRGQEATLTRLLTSVSAEQPWEHQRQILRDELELSDLLEGLRRLPGMLEKMARDVERSKAKDDERGARIIDDYAEAHRGASSDGCVLRAWEETRRLQREVHELILSLEARQERWPPRGALQPAGHDHGGHLEYPLIRS